MIISFRDYREYFYINGLGLGQNEIFMDINLISIIK